MPAYAPEMYRALHRTMRAGLVRACHDLSEGGLAIAAAEMCIGGRLGLDLRLGGIDSGALFAETNGSLLVEVKPDDCAEFESQFAESKSVIRLIGTVSNDDRLTINTGGAETPAVSLPVDALVAAWNGLGA
jgi:phosphoribosylformylglycinamidine synthase subunit PurSL